MGHQGAAQGGNRLPMEQGQPSGAAPGVRQPGPQLPQPPNQQVLGLGAGGPLQGAQPGGTVRPVASGLAGAGTGASGHKQALQQLMHTLRSPQSPEQQQQILAILKSNPQLMAAFIKQRQAQAAAQQGSGQGVVRGPPVITYAQPSNNNNSSSNNIQRMNEE